MNFDMKIRELDMLLVQLVDKKVQIDIRLYNNLPHEIVDKIKSNGFSCEIIDENSKDKYWREKRLETLLKVSKIFKKENVKHVFIKDLRHLFAMMDDVDVLIPEPYDIVKATRILSDEGYKLYRFRLLSHPLKIMARRRYNEPPIDIYPDTIWVRKKVCEGEEIILKRRLDERGVYVPSVEDNFYLVATHAYFHLSIRLSELLHGISLISQKNFDFEYLFELSKKFGTLDAVYLCVLFIQQYSKIFYEDEIIQEEFLEKFRGNRICRIIDSWFRRKQLSFPFNIPIWLACFLSSFYHTPKLIGRIKAMELVDDFLTHYLSISSKIIEGKV